MSKFVNKMNRKNAKFSSVSVIGHLVFLKNLDQKRQIRCGFEGDNQFWWGSHDRPALDMTQDFGKDCFLPLDGFRCLPFVPFFTLIFLGTGLCVFELPEPRGPSSTLTNNR